MKQKYTVFLKDAQQSVVLSHNFERSQSFFENNALQTYIGIDLRSHDSHNCSVQVSLENLLKHAVFVLSGIDPIATLAQ